VSGEVTLDLTADESRVLVVALAAALLACRGMQPFADEGGWSDEGRDAVEDLCLGVLETIVGQFGDGARVMRELGFERAVTH